jgi:transposase InsO family protein
MTVGIEKEKALKRYALIAPLLEEGISAFELARRKMLVLENGDIGERTLRRWLQAYREKGFDSLIRAARRDKGSCKAIAPEVLELAEECRKELPRRSAGLIQDYLKTQGYEAARSTLERQLRVRGYSGKELQREAKASAGTRRFVRVGRNTLWQSDIKYGPYIPDPARPGKNMRTYLAVFIDDATRVVTHAQFYDNQKQPILEDALRQAIQRNGSPRSLYVDNGKIFVSSIMKLACARLSINHLNTRPYSAESKGKIERFNRTVEEFLAEYRLQKAGTLQELNRLFHAWLSERYQHKPHSALNGHTPMEVFACDKTPLRFHSLETLKEAFLHETNRRVDKTGCLKLEGRLYDAGPDLTRKHVIVRFDPFAMEEIEVWHKGVRVKNIHQAQIGEYNTTQKVPCETVERNGQSRVLKAYAQNEQKRFNKRYGAFAKNVETEGEKR